MKPVYFSPPISYSAFRDQTHFLNWVGAFHGREVRAALEHRLEAAALRSDAAVDPALELSKLIQEAAERRLVPAEREA